MPPDRIENRRKAPFGKAAAAILNYSIDTMSSFKAVFLAFFSDHNTSK